LQRRWVLAVVLGPLCAAIAAVAAWFVVPRSRYIARAMLHVASSEPNIIFQTQEAKLNFDIYKQTQLRLLKSRSVVTSVLRKPEVCGLPIVRQQPIDPLVWLEGQIQADYTGEILNISISGSRPDGLAILVNSVVERYLEEVVNVEAKERRKRYDKLKEIYGEYQAKLQAKRETLEELAKQIGSTDKANVRLTHAFAIESRAAMEKELRQLRIDLRKAETELAVRRRYQSSSTAGSAIPDYDIHESMQKDELVRQYSAQIARLNKSLSLARSRVRNPSDPSVQGLMKELGSLTRALAAREAGLRPLIVARLLAQGHGGQDPDDSTLEERIAVLKELERTTAADVKGLAEEVGSINENSLHLEALQDEIALADVASKRVGNEVEALSVELNAPSRVRLIEPADPPRMEADKRPRMAGMAGFGAFALVLLGISWCEFRVHRIGSADEVVQGLGIRLVGTLPPLPNRTRRLLAGPDASRDPSWHARLVESIDNTRTNLLYAASSAVAPRAVMVTSAVGGEGKTSLACHLATSIARTGWKTLLIDGDLRRPAGHQLLNLPLAPGFSELVRGEVDLDDVIRPTFVGCLWMIPAGLCDDRAIQALAREDLRQLFEQLRGRFDFIMVDTPPVLPVSDALMIGRHVDAVICSVLRGVSQLPKVYAAYERLQSLGIRILGAVMAGVRNDIYDADYQYLRKAQVEAEREDGPLGRKAGASSRVKPT
jgi:capsular exopolysaccharide synthesis family protein